MSNSAVGRAVGALLATAAVVAATTSLASAGPTPTPNQQHPTTAAPTLSGPVTGGTHGFPFTASSVDLRSHGYAEQEFFFGGTAHSFTSAQPLTSDGRWQVQQAASARYESRMIVRAPTDPNRFNGTVIVEWLNVSAGRDIDVDWDYGFSGLMNDGFAYVGVTAQAVGSRALTAWDPARYGAMSIPSDDFSYDIFSQAGAAVRSGDVLHGLRVRNVIADGESQSAGRMTTYVDAVAPIAKVYDGFLIHSNSATGSALSATVKAPTPTLLRTDLNRPVLNLETETDVLSHVAARQPDDRFHRLWEAAGTAHVDNDVLTLFGYQDHRQTPQDIDPTCTAAFNTAPESYLFDTAYRDLRTWVRTGQAPPVAPRMRINAAGTDVARDAFGNGIGGIRLPQLAAPIATLTGVGNRPADTNPVSIFCVLFGTAAPFDAATLARLYPTHTAYVRAFTAATLSLARQGFLTKADVADALFGAQQAPVPTS
ncbi:MAG TPA: alpha/beta hydrolase domain-containing protein [Pseudonocardiaceae bacterium]|nr:alpha/beta hydrolase domain-containing protein [Pseudonocardiaceae bacterium]